MTKQKITVSKSRADVDITYRFSPRVVRGWSPSIFFDNAGGSELSLTGTTLTITMNHSTPATQNDFADPNGGLTDLEYFDCYRYNVSTDTVELDTSCGCSDYAIQIFDADVTTSVQASPGRNHWTGTITVSAADAAVVTLDNADDIDDATDKIMIFNTYDNCEDCQQNYLFFADSNGELGAANDPGGRWT